MDEQKSRMVGEQFNQASRLLFDAAANKWYLALGLEIVAGLLSVVLSILDISGSIVFWPALIGLMLLGVAYYLRRRFEDLSDTAETMRRQAAFTEGLGWPIDVMQATEWMRKLGPTIRAQVKTVQRDPDYYNTQKAVGPQRLAEMTIESAFYTRQLYLKLRAWMWWLFCSSAMITIVIMSVTIARLIPGPWELPVARAVFTFIPIILSANFLGYALVLGRLSASIGTIEADLRRTVKEGLTSSENILRLVSEYNCQVEMGIPIHPWLWQRWHGDISDLWDNPLHTSGMVSE